ncbi:MAG: bifunctional DNA-formamidopyrimidine glycosylase/DNA-(apurinic or apyrimidinic site) lyase [Planctomycetes bacterium]|nr:bifunctional DNA-formamidopyrimidine glycosylase/DNA-(apurinic or apyrimidinic site) lyase [Planctomycetota bacterium]
MPELPEVEVTRRSIEPKLVGRVIAAVHTGKPSYFFLTPPRELQKRLTGRKVTGLNRHGKYLLAKLDDGSRLLLHLGMTGQLFTQGASSVRLLSATARASLKPQEQPQFTPDKHTHLRLTFADGPPDVIFRDVRKFGKVKLLDKNESDARLDKLGPDALEATADQLFRAITGREIAIKSALMDQGVLAGAGNIYADEALFLAGIQPKKPAGRLKKAQCEALLKALQGVLRRSIETGGSSISDYVTPDGSDGGYQDERRVYARTGAPCYACGTAIKRVVIGQRSAHYCPQCQK